MTFGPEELSFRARALAQTHPLTPVAKRIVDRAVGEQQASQPMPEIGIWAGSAIINGYCLRRVEEVEAGFELGPAPVEPDVAELDSQANRIAADLRTGGCEAHLLGDEERTLAALDNLIAKEVNNRLESWGDDLDEGVEGELEEYVTWWVVKGYALRVAELGSGALV